MSPGGGLRFEGRGEVYTRRFSLLWGALALSLTSLALRWLGTPPWATLVEQVLALWLVLAFAGKGYRVRKQGVVFADRSGVRVGREMVAPRDRITDASMLSPDDPVVRIGLLRTLSIDVHLEGEEQARALLTALGMGGREGAEPLPFVEEEERPDGMEALLAPGGRDLARWLTEVRAAARASDYRHARLDAARLWRVVDDATLSPATRAGAALAIASLDEPPRARLRVAAEGCVEPRLRVALARVAEGASDAELEEALAPLLEETR